VELTEVNFSESILWQELAGRVAPSRELEVELNPASDLATPAVTRVLSAFYERPILHSELKPENILTLDHRASRVMTEATMLAMRSNGLSGGVNRYATELQGEVIKWFVDYIALPVDRSNEEVRLDRRARSVLHELHWLETQFRSLGLVVGVRERDELWNLIALELVAILCHDVEDLVARPPVARGESLPRRLFERTLPRQTRAGPSREASSSSDEDDPAALPALVEP
jgi:hypothetical protein